MPSYGSAFITTNQTWTQLKVILDTKRLSLQFEESDSAYELYAIDTPIVYVALIYRGTVPDGVIANGYTQEQNDSDEFDFENNYKSRSNQSLLAYQQGDSRWIYRFGNLTATGSVEQLVSNQGYFEQPGQAQRSVKSTSASDANPAGSGAKQVRITFLNSNYQKKVEDVFLNGTNAVATVNTDIRFIERFEVIKGAATVGRVILCTGSTGLGEICSIGGSQTEAFLCHHYVPSGSKAEVIEWSVTASDDALMRLRGQLWTSGNLVGDTIYDLDNLTGIASGSRLDFSRTFKSMPIQEKTRVYITAQSQQGTSTTIRARMNIWEDCLFVSGST